MREKWDFLIFWKVLQFYIYNRNSYYDDRTLLHVYHVFFQGGGGFGAPPKKDEPRYQRQTKSHYETNKKQHRQRPFQDSSRMVPVDDFRMAVMRGNVQSIQKYLDQGVFWKKIF